MLQAHDPKDDREVNSSARSWSVFGLGSTQVSQSRQTSPSTKLVRGDMGRVVEISQS